MPVERVDVVRADLHQVVEIADQSLSGRRDIDQVRSTRDERWERPGAVTSAAGDAFLLPSDGGSA